MRHFGNPRGGTSDSDTRERAATCFAIGFILAIPVAFFIFVQVAKHLLG